MPSTGAFFGDLKDGFVRVQAPSSEDLHEACAQISYTAASGREEGGEFLGALSV